MYASHVISSLLNLSLLGLALSIPLPDGNSDAASTNQHKVLILGGGVAGVIAARTLYEKGIDDFLIIEARDQLGGRLTSHSFGGKVVELGANWIQGTQSGSGPANPILELAQRHNLTTQPSNFFDSMTTYDVDGPKDYLEVFNRSVDAYTDLTTSGGARVNKSLVDLTSRTGYLMQRTNPRTPHEEASEYYQANNFTFVPEEGGFSDENFLSIDQRGFKHFIQAEAAEFLLPHQVQYNALVKNISYSGDGVTVTLDNGTTLTGDYAICTFSLGVLQNDDVVFEPELPDYKWEAISSMTMATYTKIFLQFPEKFWFDTE
ncbi:hypothetical protein V5O48_006257, partial [Marasmius crinis-equi]